MLLFDFDGVLMDSLDEVVLTAYNAVTGELSKTEQELPEGFAKVLRRNRFHVQPAGDFLTIARWCLDRYASEPDRLLTAADYAAVLKGETAPLRERTAQFFKTRRALIQSLGDSWLALHKPYQPLWDALKPYAERVVILTNKNREAVLRLTSHFNMTLVPEQIYSADGGATKLSNFMLITEHFPATQYHFIDDSLGNLRELRGHLIPLLASWGYIGPEDIAVAAKEGIEVQRQESLVKLLPRFFAEPGPRSPRSCC